MKLVDSSIWVALAVPQHVHHAASADWLSREHGAGEVLFCRASQQSFLRLVTTSAILAAYSLQPLTNAQAWAVYDDLRKDPRVGYTEEPTNLASEWCRLAAVDRSSPKIWMDAYLAAFAISGGYQLVTTDHGFRAFGGLELLVLE